MLVLSRKINERIMIGDNIEIVVVAVVGDQVRIGIEAPKDIKILRSEVYEEVQNQNMKASAASKLPEAELSDQLKQMLKGNLPGNKE
ncbi:Carbon storage regulator [Dehalobacter sp. UNSWDHB]|jgi:carbon storage regulator (csrA)|uniref:carbon storage regulator CsrA n=1 Tax=unclassified Dehalobacter TaxID=2635733 RepID=UPI00028AB7FA|nr:MULTISPECIES: carbon storage regulator CsrA [unclassified Dehalobacter]AFV02595.1 Carbon storage regulator [Dehalobacter sp. DCA]AFV05581.1 Carbon storage regulator [Dehalobacter sp. CF]EQB21760.1 Carbon storage regulator [Dehalobacter sp. UNSWDHB]